MASLMKWKSSITTDVNESTMKTLPNIHLGEVLLEEFLAPMGVWEEYVSR